jgi:hypothetical protein
MTHAYSELFKLLRDEQNLELDGRMATWIDGATNPDGTTKPDVVAGLALAEKIAREHGVEGVRSLYRCAMGEMSGLLSPGSPDEDDIVLDEALMPLVTDKPKDFLFIVMVFCECTGVATAVA